MGYRDDYERSRGQRGETRYGSRGPRHQSDYDNRDMDRGAPEFSGGYICENCGSDEVAPRHGSGREGRWGARDDYGPREDYGHRDDFDRNSRMGIFDVPDAAYRRPEEDWRDDRGGYSGGGGGSRQGGYGDQWGGGDRGRHEWGSDRGENYDRGGNRSGSSERPMTRDPQEQNREYYGSDHGFRDYDRYSEYEHDRGEREGRGGRNRR